MGIDVLDFPNVLEVRNIPKQPVDRSAFCFSDQGAWFGFALPAHADKEFFGAFTGPYLITHGRWVGPGLLQLEIMDHNTGKNILMSSTSKPELTFFPGRLSQSYRTSGLLIKMELYFAASGCAMVRTTHTNTTNSDRIVQHQWHGSVFKEMATLKAWDSGVVVKLNKGQAMGQIILPSSRPAAVKISRDLASYKLKSMDPIIIPAGKSMETYITYIYTEGEGKRKELNKMAQSILADPRPIIAGSQKRWQGYLGSILDLNTLWSKDKAYRRIAVKALQTLVNNWRSPWGDLFHEGLIPSYWPGYFSGFWAWDSWKHAVALVHFNPRLAKNQIRAMFDFQNEGGMVADCVYIDNKENNWRDSKPPLAAWAVWQVYLKTKDKKFVGEMYDKVYRYHCWWYRDRDHDRNGLCEYGSTDGTIEAAKWESGMDNAVRFDNAHMVKNRQGAWSMNLESVDLNSYLYAEKQYLALMALLLDKSEAVLKFTGEAATLRKQIRSTMFDAETGFFYDIWLEDKRYNRVQGPEGWIPLWAGVASKQQAARILKVMTDPRVFATYIPFPTVARNHPQFSIKYWRGPVWLDQVYFAIQGLKRYGYQQEAQQFTRQLFDRLEGLKNSTGAIRENYNPLNGKGLKVHHFSWSAAHLLLLFMGM